MRKTALIAVVLVLCALSIHGGEMVRMPFVNDVYSLAVPEGWNYDQSEEGLVTLMPDDGDDSYVMLFPPHPSVDGEVAEYAGVVMGLLFAKIGAGQVTGEEEGEYAGYPGIVYHFAIPSGSGSLQGVGMALDCGGYGMMGFAVAPEEQFADFFETAGDILDSFKLDTNALEENADLLNTLGDRMAQEVLEILGQ